MLRRSSWFAVFLVAAGVPGCGPSAPARGEAAPRERAIPVRTTIVSRSDLSLPIEASGTLGADREADLAFKVGGVVARVLVDEGARVQRGQLLSVIDATEFKAAADQANDGLQKAERDVTRARTLHDAQSIALSEYQNAETASSLARSVKEAAEFNLRHTALLAPASGVIDKRSVQAGEIVGPGQPIFRMSTIQGGRVVRIGLVDRDRLLVKLGDAGAVRFDARPDTAYKGVVSELATSASAGTGTFEVEVRVDDRDVRDLPSGLTAKVRLARTLPQVVRVPLSALIDGDGRAAAIYMIEGGLAKRSAVHVQELDGDSAYLRDGPRDGTAVVTVGAADLTDGVRVRVATDARVATEGE